ncbi:MAG: hypothetical protein A2Y95_05850 [Deltaproteobacteria bacterium RBG_13_65_10]|nr:MAG: hypothetical protein A2Y95_05850 [Deltaproteobacteria bacterium RBG_13_65_10]
MFFVRKALPIRICCGAARVVADGDTCTLHGLTIVALRRSYAVGLAGQPLRPVALKDLLQNSFSPPERTRLQALDSIDAQGRSAPGKPPAPPPAP